jgi:hypothetical protein
MILRRPVRQFPLAHRLSQPDHRDLVRHRPERPGLRPGRGGGFTYEGLLRNAGYVHSGRTDLVVWSFVAADLG